MILLTGLYEDADLSRRSELLECLKCNVENDHLDEIHLFVEEPLELDRLLTHHSVLAAAKIRLIAHGRRLTYRGLFTYANSGLPGRRVIVANADIFFDHTLACLSGYDLSGKLLCLSRWDVQPDGSARFFDHPASQDAWIFQAPIPDFPCGFHLGVLGCDNRLVWEAEHAGLALSNPSRSLRAYHLHLSGVRHYSERERLAGPTKSVPAGFLRTPRLAPNLPCAVVAFRETMGYTVARLEAGASSHNNDLRPFTAIPEPLSGLEFTQVVASSVSPVEVEFLTPGKLYVLVGNDWEGYYPATTWLSEKGFREDLPLVETRRGIAFEVWSLVGEAGERFVLPTQVMLATDRLVGNDGQRHSRGKDGVHLNTAAGEPIFAFTSLPPTPESAPLVRDCIASWRPGGLQARAFNHPPEIAERNAWKDCVPGRFLNPAGWERVVRPPTRHLLIATRLGCGLWSMFFEVIGLIRYAERHDLEPVVYFNDATCWWSQDGYNESRNACLGILLQADRPGVRNGTPWNEE